MRVEGVDGVGRIGQGTFTVARRHGERHHRHRLRARPDVRSAADAHRGPPAASDRARPCRATPTSIGTAFAVVPWSPSRGGELTVVGLATDAQLNVADPVRPATAPTSPRSAARNPDAGRRCRTLGVSPAEGVTPAELVRSINEQPTTSTRSPDEAAPTTARGRPGPPVVPGHLPALRPGGAVGDRAVLPDRHHPEGRRAHLAPSDRRRRRQPRHGPARPGRHHRRRWAWPSASPCTCRSRSVTAAVPLRFEAGRGRLVGIAAGARPAQLAARRPPRCWRSTPSRPPPDRGEAMKLALRSCGAGRAGSSRHRHPDARRRAGDVPRRAARRPHPRRPAPPRPGGRPDRLLTRRRDPRSCGAGSTGGGRPSRPSPASPPGGIGIVQLGARGPASGPRDLAGNALFGYELAPSGVPPPTAPGEVRRRHPAARRRRGGHGPPRPGAARGDRRVRHDTVLRAGSLWASPARGVR